MERLLSNRREVVFLGASSTPLRWEYDLRSEGSDSGSSILTSRRERLPCDCPMGACSPLTAELSTLLKFRPQKNGPRLSEIQSWCAYGGPECIRARLGRQGLLLVCSENRN